MSERQTVLTAQLQSRATSESRRGWLFRQERAFGSGRDRGDRIVRKTAIKLQREPEFGEGIIEISGKGFGFLRDAKRNFVQTPQDIFVTPEIVRRFGLRDGMWIHGETRRGNRGPQLTRLQQDQRR